MTIRPLLRFPDPRLRQAAAPVERFDEALAALAQDVLETMRAAPGIGITACHLGIPTRLVVLELEGWEAPRFYANPRLLWASDARITHLEGSVCMPGVSEQVERAAAVRIAYQQLDGTPAEEAAEGLHAICHQHEIDQLDGIFWTQRLSRLKRDRLVRKFQKLG
ncbi:peptide deformylase [Pseudoroseomonas deserti]|uniref:Peptide deformylase-like n=1 Tax=Teichococcus deserti TaxID=1817963 RepID=A0A1V2H5Q7_9PROT|nr:peptide deformylase [Pseudoroseomonas deserti]ONG56749.1 peptide deformylase [Pseudoroseomonas deserti]